MESIRQIQKKYCTRAITAAIFTGFFFILAGQKPVGKGLILGTFFSILNFILMGEILPFKMDRTKGKTFVFSLGSFIFRNLLLAVPLIMAIKLEQYNFFAVVIGIFFVQLFILADHIFNYLSSARGKQV